MEYRIGKTNSAHFNSFKEAYSSMYGDAKKKKKNEAKTAAAREEFLPVCKYCGNKMTYAGGNVLVCSASTCKGKPHKIYDSEGNEKTIYLPVYRILKRKDERYAEKLFEEE